jgi:hypothetical protein
MYNWIDIFIHKKSANFEKKLFGCDLNIKGKLAIIGNILQQIKTKKQCIFIFIAQSF